MTLRRGWLFGFALVLGCQTLVLPDTDADAEAGRPLGFYDGTLADDPAATRSALGLAAEALQQGDERAACEHLGKYLALRPDHNEVRLHYAELLLRQERRAEARKQYQRFLALAQELGDQSLDDRIVCHSRLLEMAIADDDEYGIRYHRGLGLYLLALERVKLGDIDGELPVQSLLCRAAGELTTALQVRPGQAQPCWYLYKVWSALGQQSAAARWLQRAAAAAPFGPLTAAEQRELQLACAMPRQATSRARR
jgi:hypothetical protein